MAAILGFRLTQSATTAAPNTSLGGTVTTEIVSATALNNLFPDVTPAEATSGITEQYRAIDIYNSGNATAVGIKLYMSSITTSTDTKLELAIDATATQQLASDTTTPATPALSFAERGVGSELSITDIAASGSARIFIKRVVTAGATNIASDSGTLAVDYA